ncbi:XRE family transcriptional regulator [Rhizorhabdus dicambivorans]|uniref:XRE family transcriptional regulator n=2 Tax=Rhizorhabdus dicambivorans TaxID=1850238 RepID=A0A2A4FNA9_9SPHN|nr:XRE family transcriptional regulator [Rhizorhabdus dicambivorans]PCE40245.1 XRE family transcriptional regulator [Rhizorhabdus dicambivorans]
MPRSVFTEPYAALIQALIDARGQARLRQEDVASRLRKPQSFVSKVERGERRLDLVEFIVFARALDADPVAILVKLQSEVPAGFII